MNHQHKAPRAGAWRGKHGGDTPDLSLVESSWLWQRQPACTRPQGCAALPQGWCLRAHVPNIIRRLRLSDFRSLFKTPVVMNAYRKVTSHFQLSTLMANCFAYGKTPPNMSTCKIQNKTLSFPSSRVTHGNRHITDGL